MPWEDPSTAFGAPRGPQLNLPPPEIAAKQLKAAAKQAAELRVCAQVAGLRPVLAMSRHLQCSGWSYGTGKHCAHMAAQPAAAICLPHAGPAVLVASTCTA